MVLTLIAAYAAGVICGYGPKWSPEELMIVMSLLGCLGVTLRDERRR